MAAAQSGETAVYLSLFLLQKTKKNCSDVFVPSNPEPLSHCPNLWPTTNQKLREAGAVFGRHTCDASHADSQLKDVDFAAFNRKGLHHRSRQKADNELEYSA